jgi:hypothetical protein
MQFISPSHLVFVLVIIYIFLISHEITNVFQFHPLLIFNLLDLVSILLITIFIFIFNKL